MKLNTFITTKTELNFSMKQWLAISCCFSCLLLCGRIAATGYPTYLFLVWNLFLAFIPYGTSEWLFQNLRLTRNKWKLAAILTFWILFIPNSFYIVTDLFHLEQFNAAPKWFDLLLLFSFAWNGMLLGILSVRKVELILRFAFRKRFSLLFLFIVMWLNAFGIYVGRYLRYNSWDVMTQPYSLFEEILQVIIHPLRNKMEWGMISVWAIFMTLLYVTVKKTGESFILHSRR